jgi:HPP family protein
MTALKIAHDPRQLKVARYLGLVHSGEEQLADALTLLADRHDRDPDVEAMLTKFARWSRTHMENLDRLVERMGEQKSEHPQRLRAALYYGTRMGGIGLIQDLHDLSVEIASVRVGYQILEQAAKEMRDSELETVATEHGADLDRMAKWAKTKLKQATPQALVVPSDHDSELPASVPKRFSLAGTPDAIYAPTAATSLLLLVGLVAVLAGDQPWLLPSLGPTAYLVAGMPALPESRTYNIVVGHLIGIAVGFAAVYLLGAYDDPVVLTAKTLTIGRALASALAIALLLLTSVPIRASHPPAAATILLITLGSLKTAQDAVSLMVGVLIIAAGSELFRRLRLRQMPGVPKPTEHSRRAIKGDVRV